MPRYRSAWARTAPRPGSFRDQIRQMNEALRRPKLYTLADYDAGVPVPPCLMASCLEDCMSGEDCELSQSNAFEELYVRPLLEDGPWQIIGPGTNPALEPCTGEHPEVGALGGE